MKYTNILLVFALFLFANATDINSNYEFASFAQMGEISRTTFGKNLLETVNIALKNGGDINSVQKLLDGLLDKLIKDQKAADIAWETESKRLKELIKKLTVEINNLKVEIDELTEELAKYRKLVKQSKINLAQYRAQLALNKKQINDIKKLREQDAADYERSQSEHRDIINALTQVIKELEKLRGSISGKGRPEDVKEIAQETRDRKYAAPKSFAEINHSTLEKLEKSFLQITGDEDETAIFVQMATSADQDSLNKLIALLNKLKRNTVSSLDNDTLKEKKSIKQANETVQRIESDSKTLGKNIIKQQQHLVTYEAKVVFLVKKIDLKTKVRNSKIAERKSAIKEHEIKEKAYEQEKIQRKEEIDVVVRLIDLVKKRLANMSKYLSENTGA